MKAERVIGIDLGGTNARFWISRPDEKGGNPVQELKFICKDHKSLEEIVQKVRSESGASISRLCAAVAGPVSSDGDSVKLTNLPWPTITRESLASAIGVTDISAIKIINDFAGIGFGIPVLKNEDIHHFEWSGKVNPNEPIRSMKKWAIIGPGTGVGKGKLFFLGDKVVYSDSEGSHANYAPVGRTGVNFLKYLIDNRSFNFVSQETVLRGTGLKLLYDFVRDNSQQRSIDPEWLTSSEDPSAEITKRAKDGSDRLCDSAHKLYESILGSVVGNDAMDMKGGVILAGGITPKIVDRLIPPTSPFAMSYLYRESGNFVELAKRLPVIAILNDRVGVMGATESAKPINDGNYELITA